MREPDAVDAARVLALALLAIAATILLVWAGVDVAFAGAFQQIAFLVGPLIIGFTAQHLSLPAALGIIVVALLCVAGGSVVLRRTGG